MLCSGCANRYFAWNKPLPVDNDYGFVQTSYDYNAGPLSLRPPSDSYDRSRVQKELCRELGKQNIPCPMPTRLR
jgi:hypothetical protein